MDFIHHAAQILKFSNYFFIKRVNRSTVNVTKTINVNEKE